MEYYKPNNYYATSESAPLIEPVDGDSDQDLFMVPLKRRSPRLPPSRYRNVKPRTPPRSPAGAPSPKANPTKASQPTVLGQRNASPYQTPPMSETGAKPNSPPMFASPLMSGESKGSPEQRGTATLGSLAYNSPPMSERATKAGSSPNMSIMSPQTGSAGQSPQPGSSGKGSTQPSISGTRSTGKDSPSTKASSVYDGPAAVIHITKPEPETATNTTKLQHHRQAPQIPPLSQARSLRRTPQNLGLALHLDLPPATPNSTAHLAPPASASHPNWTVPDSPFERLSQLRATPDSAYDRARVMELRRSEWKHAVYRFPVKGAEHWVIDADLTESSHARLADVARRSSEGFEWNGDHELAGIYRVLAAAHGKVMEEMRGERRGMVSVVA